METSLEPTILDSARRIFGAIAPLLKSTGKQQFPTLLSEKLEKLVAYDSLMIIRYGERPVVEHVQYPLKSFPEDAQVYTSAAYLIDPFYRATVDRGLKGFRTLKDIAPDSFRESEYHRRYYVKTGLGDEVDFIFDLDDGSFLSIAICRFAKHSPFQEDETALLEALCPLLEVLCQMHWNQLAQQNSGGRLNKQLKLALASFGSIKLTPRECDIVQLLLQGHSTQSMSDKLEISMETVKIHRRNSYKKLDINSQSELFHLFISALQSFDVYSGGDPLAGYY